MEAPLNAADSAPQTRAGDWRNYQRVLLPPVKDLHRLDVYEREPELAAGLSEQENAVLLPHLGSATVETRAAMAGIVAENIIAVLEGRSPRNSVHHAI